MWIVSSSLVSTMSFYDLAKDNALSAQDLFKYRVKRDSTIPSRGGQKDFEPDGSWLQSKTVEAFIQERTSVLGEARVEKLKSLVQGTWEPDKQLVNVDKPGKFWAHMGFTDKRRNWLYPEEALFLLETNSLEVHEHGIPVSIQEAYSKFLSGSGVSLEEYQVFAHLRRLGFVVLRHEEQPILTDYERKMNLDKYIGKQTLKERKSKLLQKKKAKKEAAKSRTTGQEGAEETNKTREAGENSGVNNPDCESGHNDVSSKASEDVATVEPLSAQAVELSNNTSEELPNNIPSKRLREDDDDSILANNSNKKFCSDKESSSNKVDNTETSNGSNNFYSSCWSSCFENKSSRLIDSESDNESRSSAWQQTEWSSDSLPFPNIADKDIVSLSCPAANLVPPNLELPEGEQQLFDVEQYRIKNPPQTLSRQAQREEDRDSRVRSLDFSFAEWTQRKPKVQASNWGEYKRKVAERMHELATTTPVDHLWQGDDVTPLIRPGDATSFGAVLNKLSIVQSVDNKDLEAVSSNETPELKVSYDVHLPDHRFKKSMPGIPNHRVCVSKCASEPLSLPQIQQYWHMYKDDVPLHCAVVDSGEIAFYVFDNLFQLENLG